MARLGEKRDAYGIWVETPDGKRPLEDLSVDGKIILKMDLQVVGRKVWTELMWLGIGTFGGFF